MPAAIFRAGDRPLLHLGLLAATLLTTTGTFYLTFGQVWADSLAFSISLLVILGSHEMGHYLLARVHGVDSSLPYFIPAPMLGVGTLGAVIRIRGRIPHREALVDIGAAGPLAGLAVAIPILLYGLAHSQLSPSPISRPPLVPGPSSLWELLPELWRYLAEKLAGTYAPAPPVNSVWLFGDNLLMLALQRLVKGPLPEGHDLIAHPMVIAGWFGLLVTMLNLIPIGQLDGGHLAHAILGRRAVLAGKLMALAMLLLCVFVSAGWLLWLIITSQLIGFKHPEVLRPEAPLSLGRRLLCLFSLVALVLCVMPAPITMVSAP